MSTENLVNAIGEIDEELIYNAVNDNPKANKFYWKKLITLAACICIIAVIWSAIPETPELSPAEPGTPNLETDDTECGPPSFEYNGINYIVSSYLTKEKELPEGFVYAGETTSGGFKTPNPFYVNPDIPEWIYVYQPVYSNRMYFDSELGEYVSVPPENFYLCYVDSRLRGKKLINYDGEMYISLFGANYYGETPDVTEEYYNAMASRYSYRIEGEAPDGFVFAGKSVFCGFETVPQESLEANTAVGDIYYSVMDSSVIIAAENWHSANGIHYGFDVYIKYDCPFVEE